jgi:hypothetical protein
MWRLKEMKPLGYGDEDPIRDEAFCYGDYDQIQRNL